jgi:hypothetical protein
MYQAVSETPGDPLDMPYIGRRMHRRLCHEGAAAVMMFRGASESPIGDSQAQQVMAGLAAFEIAAPTNRRNSLEALGLLRVTYDRKPLDRVVREIAAALPDKFKAEADAFVHYLLMEIRRQRAISDAGVDLTDPLIWTETFAGPAGSRSFELAKEDTAVKFRLIRAVNRHNRRSWFLQEQFGLPPTDAEELMKVFWAASIREKLLVRARPGHVVDMSAIRVATADDVPLYRCGDCGLRHQIEIDRKCIDFGCRGQLEPISADERASWRRESHYVRSYASRKRYYPVAREHTAAIGKCPTACGTSTPG